MNGNPLHIDHVDFSRKFKELTGHEPYHWQSEMFRFFLSDSLPPQCCVPTGLGKTSLMHIWLLALAWQAERRPDQRHVPLRLFWVVDRRVVVDQATSEAEALVQRLENEPGLAVVRDSLRRLSVAGAQDSAVAVSTLRGEHADNRAWSRDPSRPAIVVGTVDMIGSRLLFSGYGDSRRRRPHHAGLMAQDSLIVNDEAHLTPAFARLLEQVAGFCSGARGLRVMLLSATPRENMPAAFRIEPDKENRFFQKPYRAIKHLHLVDAQNVQDKIQRLACSPSGRTAVFVRSPDEARRLAAAVNKANPGLPISLLTGMQRGKERDELLLRPAMQPFLCRDSAPSREPCWLLATSAGEVGVDLSCDRLITDLDSAEHMLQRFGRLNRFGETEGHAYVVYSPTKTLEERASPALKATIAYLKTLPDVSPATLAEHPPPPESISPPPRFSTLEPWLVDAWSATSITTLEWPARPPVEFWLRGDDEEGSPPETYVAWREDVPDLFRASPRDLEEVFECYPILARERLRQYTPVLCRQLDQARLHGAHAVVITSDGEAQARTIGEILENPVLIRYGILVLPPGTGHLDEYGMVDWTRTSEDLSRYDVSADGGRMRIRLGPAEPPPETTLSLRFELEIFGEDQDEPSARWLYYSAQPSRLRTTVQKTTLSAHQEQAARVALDLARRLGLDARTAQILEWAAKWHDAGKARPLWQLAAGNPDPTVPLAKSQRFNPRILDGFRHEFGSVLDAAASLPADFTPEECALALHLIAAHHGWARPHFTTRGFDRLSLRRSAREALEVARRFGRLQQSLGAWRLAYLEALLRCADALASEGFLELPVYA